MTALAAYRSSAAGTESGADTSPTSSMSDRVATACTMRSRSTRGRSTSSRRVRGTTETYAPRPMAKLALKQRRRLGLAAPRLPDGEHPHAGGDYELEDEPAEAPDVVARGI